VGDLPTTDFQRPDVAPLPAEGKFQVVSDSLLMLNGQYVQFDSGFSPGLIDGM